MYYMGFKGYFGSAVYLKLKDFAADGKKNSLQFIIYTSYFEKL